MLSSVAHGFHIMKWDLNPTKYRLITPTSFVPLVHQHLLQVTLVDHRVYGWFGVTFLPWLCAEYLPVPGTLVHRGEGLERNQLDFSVFNKLYSCWLQRWGITISLEKAINSFESSLYCLGLSMGPLLANNLVRWNPFLEMEVSFGGESSLVGVFSPLLFGHLGSFHIWICFKAVLLY